MKLQRSLLNLHLVEVNIKFFYDANRCVFRVVDYNGMCVLQRQSVGLMLETTLETLRVSTVFTLKIVGVFKTETRRGMKKVNLTLTFTTSTGDTSRVGSRDKKDLHKT